MLLEFFVLFTCLSYLLYKWSTANYGKLKARNIAHNKPLPLLGTIPFSLMMGKSSFYNYLIDTHQQFKNNVYGIYQMREPFVVVRDTELLKKVAIKDFDHFANHMKQFGANDEPIVFNGLINLRDAKWKAMRSTLSPSFTGSKMRLMHELINECCAEAANYQEANIKASAQGYVDIDLRNFFTKFTNDVIASVAFGLKLNSFEDESNDFFTLGKTVTNFTPKMFIKAMLMQLIPKIMKKLRVEIFDKKQVKYFRDLVMNAINYREEQKIVRPDMITLLLEAKKQVQAEQAEGKEMQMTFENDDILAQCFLFFFAGFETVSSCLVFTAYELAKNPEVHQELYEEIQQTLAATEGKIVNYDVLMKMKYLDMVLSESLRKWPPAVATDRCCSQDYDLLDDEGNLVVQFKKDEVIMINILGSHYDPENFEDPYKFEPRRFAEENKDNIKPLTYMPFGVGPRSCIANRLALMEVKSLLCQLVGKFELLPNEKTPEDLIKAFNGFNSRPNELWMRLKPRNN